MGFLFSAGPSRFSGRLRGRSRTRSSSSDRVSVSARIAFKRPTPPPPPRPRAVPQPKAPVQTTALRNDQAPEQTKKPKQNLGAQQKIANAGDSIPIVFCAPTTVSTLQVGGVWVSPSLSKWATLRFVGAFLYPISQGKIVSSPEKHLAFNGTENIKMRGDESDISLTHYYSTTAALASSPNSCPITSGGGPTAQANDTFLFCDEQIVDYLQTFAPGRSCVDRIPDWNTYLFTFLQTVGTGNLSNTVLEELIADQKCFEIGTGVDRTAAYQAVMTGLTRQVWNGRYQQNPNGTQTLLGGNPPGTIEQLQTAGTFRTPRTANFLGGTANLAITSPSVTVNNQANTGSAATDSTLEAVRESHHMSPYADSTSPPTSANYQSFADITFLQIRGNIFDEKTTAGVFPETTRQLNIYYASGVEVDLYSQAQVSGAYQKGASNQFVDLAMFLFQLLRRVDGATTANIAAPIDTSNLLALASFCTNNSTYFNGMVDQQVNAIEYLSQTAPFFLLRFISSNGRYSLQPILPMTATQTIDLTALTPAATFTDAQILPGTYNKTYAETEQRRDFIAQILYRDPSKEKVGSGLTLSVRFTATAVDAPVEQFDLTDCCSNALHAYNFAKYQLAFRKHVTHSISFAIPLDTTGLIPTQIIRVQRSRVSSVGDNRTETENYQIEKVRHSTEGTTIIEATHFPLTAGNISEISNEMATGAFTFR